MPPRNIFLRRIQAQQKPKGKSFMFIEPRSLEPGEKLAAPPLITPPKVAPLGPGQQHPTPDFEQNIKRRKLQRA